MTEKRFTLEEFGLNFIVNDNGRNLTAKQTVDRLNDLNDENEQIRNKKERYKRLSEIRREEINNRILTIKEFIENCSDNKVKKILKDLFYSEVKEYDLSAQNRKLLHENEKLKQKYNDAKKDVEKKEQILKDIMKDNLLIQDMEKELDECLMKYVNPKRK